MARSLLALGVIAFLLGGVAVIFIGTFFQLVLLVADVSSNVARDLLDSA